MGTLTNITFFSYCISIKQQNFPTFHKVIKLEIVIQMSFKLLRYKTVCIELIANIIWVRSTNKMMITKKD